MFSKKSILPILLLLNYSHSARSVGLRKNVEIEKVQVCPENDKMEVPLRNLKFTKINKTHSALSMDFAYPKDIDENTGFTVKLERWSDGGGWIEWPFLPRQKDMCNTMMKLFPSIWIDVNRSTNITHPEKCPIPAGYYHMENHIFDFSQLNAPVRLGKFRTTIKVTDAKYKEVYYCLIVEVGVDQQAKSK